MALVCSGALHAIVILSAARFIAAMPIAGPRAEATSAPLVAVLQAPPPPIPAVDLLPLPPLPPELTAPPLPEPARESPSAPAGAPAAPAPTPTYGISPLDLPIAAADPNGRISYGVVRDPAVVSRAIARRLAERYPTAPYKRPNVQGSLSLAYPQSARESHTSARIAAVLDLDERGTITAISLVPQESVFGPAVLAALKDARLSPAATPTGPMPYWAIVEFVFTISAAPAVGTSTANASATR